MTSRRLTPDERRAVIVAAAVKLTRDAGGDVFTWTRHDVAEACVVETSAHTVKAYFTMPDLRNMVRRIEGVV